jgi:iron complex outermembrane recepter protein
MGIGLTRGSRRGAGFELLVSGLAASLFVHGVAIGADNTGVEAGDLGDEIVVTGYRGSSHTVADSLVPIDVVTPEALLATGKTDLRQALTDLVPSLHTTMSGSGTGRGNVSFSLRGLSSNETLILVNGKRWHGSALVSTSVFGASAPDLGLIPMSSVERVEVLRDGAAAQYGADAIAGVINIILKSSGIGGGASLLAGELPKDTGGTSGRGRTETLLGDQGFTFGNGAKLNVSIDASHQEDSNPMGPLRSSYHIYPLLADGSADPRETSESRYRYISGLPRETHVTAGFNASLPITDSISLYGFGDVAYRKNFINGSFRSPTNLLGAAVVSLYPDGYMSPLQVDETDFQVVAGAKWAGLFGWDWDLSVSDASDNAKLLTPQTANPSFGPDSKTSFYNGRLVLDEAVVNLNATHAFHTGLLEDDLHLATGIEYRNTEWKQEAGEYESYADGGYVIPSGPFAGQSPSPGTGFQAGFSPSQSGDWSRQNKGVYFDLDQHVTGKWEVSLAGRFEHYSTFDDAWSGKFSTRYEINSVVAFRATVNNGFAAPSIQQQHYRYNQPQYNTNPNTGVVTKTGSRYVTDEDATGIALGATALKPEKSLNYSAGFAFRPSDNSNITLDAYQIAIRDRIRLSSAFDGTTNVAVRNALVAAGQDYNQQIYYFTNIGDTRTRGLDLTADYTSRFERAGTVKWSVKSNQSEQEITRVAPTPTVLANAGLTLVGRDAVGQLTQAYPKNTTTFSAAWTLNRFDVTARANRYSKVTVWALQGAARDSVINAATIFDLDVGVHVTDAVRLSAGANNLFDKKPNTVNPTVLGFNTNFLSQPVYAEGSPYGYNGGFYYARVEARW